MSNNNDPAGQFVFSCFSTKLLDYFSCSSFRQFLNKLQLTVESSGKKVKFHVPKKAETVRDASEV
jgi:hypothetical protein